MKAKLTLCCLLVVWFGCLTSFGRDSEGARTNSILLNGQWEFVVGDVNESAETSAGQERLSWRPVTLPGPFMKWSQEAANHTKYVWARRNFTVTPAQARSLAVLRWNRIGSGAVAFVNGQKVGDHEPTGPFQVVLPPGVLQPGENQIVLKVRGRAAVRKSKSGNELIPAGFGSGIPEVTDDLWMDFADTAYMKWVLAIPDLAGARVKIRVTPTGLNSVDDLQVMARVQSWPEGKVFGEGQTSARLRPDPDPLGGEHFFVEVPMPGFEPWSHERPQLYSARVTLVHSDRKLDEVTFRFGMREIRVKDRNYQLNGRNLWLRGSNLVFEWDWADTITGHEYDYLVTEAREMSMNCFRTHTRPPPRLWCDIGDEYGTMILAEFPVLFNYQDYKFTPEEWEIWHRNCLLDAAGWMARLWNHPSVIMWVLSNESQNDNAWEEKTFQDFVNKLDPTRPTMRTGTTGTRENYDVHACGNVTETDEGNLQPLIQGWFREAGNRTTTCSEYMNYFGHPYTQWTGVDDRLANALAVAQIGAEHTEAMRRARLDAILPYMYAGWTRTRLAARVRETGQGSAVWKAGYAAPESAAWHSSLSPVLASLDLFDASYRTGQEVTTDLCLINDSWNDAKVHVDLLLTRECPEFIPEAACFDRPVSKWSFDFKLNADSLEKVPVKWQLPEQEGNYWLTARLTGVPGRPVLSQRFIRAINPPAIPDSVRKRTYIVLGGTDAARAFFNSHGLRASEWSDDLSPATHFVVIWDVSRLTDDDKRRTKLCDFAGQGGQVMVLSSSAWNWSNLCDVRIGKPCRFSRVFAHQAARDDILVGFDPAWLVRWNGYPGTVGLAPLEGPVMARAEKLLWAKEPDTTVAARVPAAEGGGKILFVELDLQRRVDRSSPYYDPAAERLLANLLAAGTRE